MEKEQSIKNQNRKYLILYLFVNIIIFAVFANIIEMSFRNINELWTKLRNPQGIIAVIIVPLTIVLEGFLSSHIKAVLVFCRFKDPLPGNRAFSEIAKNDHRVDLNKLVKIFSGNLPQSSINQNKEWYKLYRKHEDKVRVLDAHRSFLLTRDLTALTAILILICITAHILWGTTWKDIAYHYLLLGVLFFICRRAAYNYGKSFVANVLVEALNQNS